MKLRFLRSVGCGVVLLAGVVYTAGQVQNGKSGTQSRGVEPTVSKGVLQRQGVETTIGADSVIRIIKQAAPESVQIFGFSTTGTGLSNFTLVDDGVDNDATPNSISFNNLLSPGQSGSFTVTETANGFYDLTNLSCSVTGTGGSTASPNLPAGMVSITLQFGDTVTCTFFNSVITAANVSISGRVITPSGRGISRALVSIVDASSGEARRAVTNGFGYYSVEGLETGTVYMITVAHKQYVFESRTITLQDSLDGFDFIGN